MICDHKTNDDRNAKGVTAISLFTGGGIGDLALRACGMNVLVASELLLDRAQVYRENFPETTMIIGDIRKKKKEIIDATRQRLGNRRLDVLFATPPCQGMSKNGRGKLLNGIRAGNKPRFDERNTLIFEAVDLVQEFQPKIVIFENVPEMEFTLVEAPDSSVCDILSVVKERLTPAYHGGWSVIEFADYGVPQRRRRLITVFSSVDPLKTMLRFSRNIMPEPTHSESPTLYTQSWVSVQEALKCVPPLDASTAESARHNVIPYHRVPVLSRDKYFWVSNTPPGRGAFDNQCVNPDCGCLDNPVHSSCHDTNGINRAKKDTPIRCLRCGKLLPRPWVIEHGEHRLMSGFTSAYKRMRGDMPASALTRNLSYACSDQKLHPVENRVLSLHEAFILHTISCYEFKWRRRDGQAVSDKTIREIIGESIPPKGLEVILQHVLGLAKISNDELAHIPVGVSTSP